MFKNKFNWRNVVAIAICLAGFTVFSGCSKDKDNSDDDFNNLGLVVPERDADPHIFVNMKDDSFLAFYTNVETGNMKSAIYDNGTKTVLIRYGVDGLPLGAYSENRYYIFLYSGNTMTIEIYNANDQKIDEQNVQGDDIAELIKDSPYLRSASFSPICVSPIFAKNVKATNQAKNTLGIPKDETMLNDLNRITVSDNCREDLLKKKFSNNSKNWSAARFTNRANEILKKNMQEQYKMFDKFRNKFPGKDTNIDLPDQKGEVNGPLDEGGKKPIEEKGCWIMTYTLTCTGISPVTTSETVCDMTESKMKEEIRKVQETVNQSLQGSGCNGNYTYRRQ